MTTLQASFLWVASPALPFWAVWIHIVTIGRKMTDIYKAAVDFIWRGDHVFNIYYFETAATTAEASALVASEYVQAMMAPIAGKIINDFDGDHLNLYARSGSDWLLVAENTFSFTGTEVAEVALPRQSAAVVIGQTGVRRCQGRKFIAGLSVDVQDGGLLTDDFHLLMTDYKDVYINPFTGTGASLTPGVWHPATNSLVHFTSGRVDRALGSQRRRKFGVGI